MKSRHDWALLGPSHPGSFPPRIPIELIHFMSPPREWASTMSSSYIGIPPLGHSSSRHKCFSSEWTSPFGGSVASSFQGLLLTKFHSRSTPELRLEIWRLWAPLTPLNPLLSSSPRLDANDLLWPQWNRFLASPLVCALLSAFRLRVPTQATSEGSPHQFSLFSADWSVSPISHILAPLFNTCWIISSAALWNASIRLS